MNKDNAFWESSFFFFFTQEKHRRKNVDDKQAMSLSRFRMKK